MLRQVTGVEECRVGSYCRTLKFPRRMSSGLLLPDTEISAKYRMLVNAAVYTGTGLEPRTITALKYALRITAWQWKGKKYIKNRKSRAASKLKKN
jgi:hypothetical protein